MKEKTFLLSDKTISVNLNLLTRDDFSFKNRLNLVMHVQVKIQVEVIKEPEIKALDYAFVAVIGGYMLKNAGPPFSEQETLVTKVLGYYFLWQDIQKALKLPYTPATGEFLLTLSYGDEREWQQMYNKLEAVVHKLKIRRYLRPRYFKSYTRDSDWLIKQLIEL